MARHLGALPGRKPCIEVAKLPLGLGLQPFDLGGNVDAAVVCGIAKVRNSRLQLRNGLFELKKRGHWRWALLAGGLAVNEGMLRSEEFDQRIRLQMGRSEEHTSGLHTNGQPLCSLLLG